MKPKLKLARQNAGLTQVRMAQFLGTSRSNVAMIEAGWKPLPGKFLPKVEALINVKT